MKKLMSLAAFGLGYVLGARAGRERYDQLMRGFTRVKEDPRVQEQARNVADMAKEQADRAKEQAPAVMDKVSDVASSAVQKVRPSSSESSAPDDSPAFGEGAEATPAFGEGAETFPESPVPESFGEASEPAPAFVEEGPGQAR